MPLPLPCLSFIPSGLAFRCFLNRLRAREPGPGFPSVSQDASPAFPVLYVVRERVWLSAILPIPEAAQLGLGLLGKGP